MADRPVPTVILCGGRGTRISSYDATIPKPLVPIGPRPILWHIMKIYSSQGYSDFVLALGWMGEEIRRYFLQYDAMTRDVVVDLGAPGALRYMDANPEADWQVTLRDTGRDTLTGSRLLRAVQSIEAPRFMVTYGDCVGNVDIGALMAHHLRSGCLATVTAVQPPSRFGELIVDEAGGMVSRFEEKPQTSGGAINGGFMIFEAEAFERYFDPSGDQMLEREPLQSLAADGQLNAYVHPGFWQPMDTPRERDLLDALWTGGQPPWKVWN